MNSKHRELLARFVRASSSGDAEELIALLEADVVLYSDGGGKSFALPNPVHGSQNVARAIVQGGARFRPAEPVVTCDVEVNGAPGVVAYLNGRPLYVLSIETHHDLVGAIYFITNPDKLSHIPRLA